MRRAQPQYSKTDSSRLSAGGAAAAWGRGCEAQALTGEPQQRVGRGSAKKALGQRNQPLALLRAALERMRNSATRYE